MPTSVAKPIWDGKSTDIPARALWFSEGGRVEFKEEKDKPKSFMVEAYTGKAMNHWYFGPIVIDIAGIDTRPSKGNKISALREHNRERIVGYAFANTKNNSVLMEHGKFSKFTADGVEVEGTLGEGQPWEASIYAGNQTRIENIEKGASAEVNGFTLAGPVLIIRECKLREFSFCIAGMDEDTSAEIAASESETVKIQIVNKETFSEQEEPMPKPDGTDAPPAVTAAQFAELQEQLKALADKNTQLSDIAKKRGVEIASLQTSNLEQGIEMWAEGLKDRFTSEESLKFIKEKALNLATNKFEDGVTPLSIFKEVVEKYVPKRSDGRDPLDSTSGEGSPEDKLRKEYNEWKAQYTEENPDEDEKKIMSFEEWTAGTK